MACFSPLNGYRSPGGTVTFRRSAAWVDRPITVACGQCWGCRLERSRQWAVRIMHEAQLHEANSFVTLTYSDDELPDHGTLNLTHWQSFAKRFRKKLGPFRFFHCGEYGDDTNRPHYHAAIFGHDFSEDRKKWTLRGQHQTFISNTLAELWPHGLHEIGDLTFQSAAYVARYIMKKRTGLQAHAHYDTGQVDTNTGEVFRLKPEYTTMSRRPGIGKTWFDQYVSDVYPSDEVIVNGQKARPPKFYDSQFELLDPSGFKLLKQRRVLAGRKHKSNNTPDRLRVRETVSRARCSQLKRNL